MVTAADMAGHSGPLKFEGGALRVRACRRVAWLLAPAFAMALGAAQAAPVTGSQETSADNPATGAAAGSLGAGRGPSQISTGNRNLDLLLEAGGNGPQGPVGAASAPGAKEPGRAASGPVLRPADLRQTLRADAATQADAKSSRRGDAGKAILGLGDGPMQADASEADPTTRRRWETPPPAGQAAAQKSGSDGESALAQAVRETIDFLRSHRVELFATIGLLLVLAAIVKLYLRRA